MKERPILFSGPMVRVILDGRKTMTRMVVKPQPTVDHGLVFEGIALGKFGAVSDSVIACPYGTIGDRLWVRETWATTEQAGVHPSDAEILYRATDPDWETWDGWRWSPSIFMPRWASRLTLRIMSVSVERVQDITEADAKAEGVVPVPGTEGNSHSYRWPFCLLWDSINAGRGFGWDANPWVWVIGFEVVPQ